MAKFQFAGIDAYIAALQKIGDDTDETIRNAIYDGAGLVADAVRDAIKALPTDSKHGTSENKIDGVTAVQKQGLLDGFGISPMKDDNGFINVKLGFAGYNKQRTKKYPNGQPNALIARSVNSGTSFRKKTQFVDKAVKSSKSACEAAMRKAIEDAIKD